MTTLRNRLVTVTNGEEHVSSLLLTTDEITQALEIEVVLHLARGWKVTRYGDQIRFEKDGVDRWVWVRSRQPMEDTL